MEGLLQAGSSYFYYKGSYKQRQWEACRLKKEEETHLFFC
ncbi:hypothetical protein V6Z11_A10G146100 [Gossypium hirsutum]